jgi:2-dehydropantoate 2-reductase
MRILIYGAGVQGSIYGGLLANGGHDVSFLARGSRALQIRSMGLVLQGAAGDPDVRVARPDIVESLEPTDHYDLCLVTVRREQIDGVLPALERSAVSQVIFMHNHADGSQTLLHRVGECRTIIAFPGAGGSLIEDGIVRYALISEQPTMVGRLGGNLRGADLVRKMFRGAGLRICAVGNPDAWLRRHAVMVGAVTGALWEFGCSAAKLAESNDGVADFIRAVREGYRALDAARVRPASLPLRAIFSWMPLRLSVAYWKKYLGSWRGEVLFAAHARHAAVEMAQISDEVAAVMRTTRVPTPTFDRLRRAIPAAELRVGEPLPKM